MLVFTIVYDDRRWNRTIYILNKSSGARQMYTNSSLEPSGHRARPVPLPPYWPYKTPCERRASLSSTLTSPGTVGI